MTSAARPTWCPAKGGNEQQSNVCSSRDLASHTSLKPRRELGQLTTQNLREELEERERRHFSGTTKGSLQLLDADDDSDGEINNDSDYDEEAEDEAQLKAELEKVRKEKAEQKLAVENVIMKVKEEELLCGNPLLNINPTSFSLKRRWDDDVVFKNQTRGDSKIPKRFVNDTIRNDFHRRFLHKYMMN
ncbi:Protein CWC15 homolog A [Linum grandiflorum]